MKYKLLLILNIVLLGIVYGYSTLNVSVENISRYIYNTTIYLSYKNDTPYFYIGEEKELKLIPPYIKVDEDIAPLVKGLGFKINNKRYNLIITKRDVNTSKMAIIFSPINGSKRIEGNRTILWIKDPLKIKQSKVEAYYILPKKGEIVAVYEDGKPAAIKINNKIYVGFKPNKEVLANLIYIHIVKKKLIKVRIIHYLYHFCYLVPFYLLYR